MASCTDSGLLAADVIANPLAPRPDQGNGALHDFLLADEPEPEPEPELEPEPQPEATAREHGTV
jgi:hypothetical protein